MILPSFAFFVGEQSIEVGKFRFGYAPWTSHLGHYFKNAVFKRYRVICLISCLPVAIVAIVASRLLHYLELEHFCGQVT